MVAQTSKLWFRVLALACVAWMPVAMSAQNSAKPAHQGTSEDSPSRFDIFAGYSYLAPHGTVEVPQQDGTTVPFSYNAVNLGGLFSGAYYFNKYVGGQVELGFHNWGDRDPNGSNVGTHGNDDGFTTISGGIIFRYPTSDITPFVHALVGGADVHGPDFNPNKWGPDLTAGGGLDYETPLLNHRLAIRIFQADYEYMHADFGPNVGGGRANINAARLSAGLVFHVGSLAPPPPVTISCSANPTSVFAGEPVTVTATAGMLNPKLNAVYSWSGDGVSGSGTTAQVNTSSLAPGSYTVKCGVKEGKPGKEGMKPWETADGTATFTVKEFEPPTISCAANPTTIKPGESSTITATGVSPQNRPLTYEYSAASGSVQGNGNSATFSSAGASTGPVELTCKVSDDKNHSATANTTVTIEAPPPPPGPSPEQVRLEARLALHSVFFPTDQPRAAHPEGGLVESQQKTLSTLATDFKSYLVIKPDAHLTLTGHADVRGSAEYNQALTERRVNRAKAFLVEQGVPENAIDTRAVGKEQELSKDEVRGLVEQNPDLSDAEKAKVLHRLNVIVLAQNRRVDITLSTTGQQSVQLYPFNAADSMTLLSEKAPAKKKAAPKKP
ncbi:MAG TPA: OmpA family protein [Terracidiphilus sp.]|nr:OmpA family protein [Terracidiphilus sp.]